MLLRAMRVVFRCWLRCVHDERMIPGGFAFWKGEVAFHLRCVDCGYRSTITMPYVGRYDRYDA